TGGYPVPTVDEGPVAALPEYFWVLWQELYNEQELQKRRAAWKSPVLRAIRKVLWKSPKHIPPDEFWEWLVDRLEQAVRSDLMQKIKKGFPQMAGKQPSRISMHGSLRVQPTPPRTYEG